MVNKRKSSKICDVNLLKPYQACDPLDKMTKTCPTLIVNNSWSAAEEELFEGVLQPRLKQSETLVKLNTLLGHLDENKCKQLVDLIQSYTCLFSDTPTHTNLMEHDVDVGDAKPITQRFYHVSPEKQKILDSEV